MNADNICGCLIETRPENGPRVAAEVAKAPGAEVHAVEGAGAVGVDLDQLSQLDHAVAPAIPLRLRVDRPECRRDSSEAARRGE